MKQGRIIIISGPSGSGKTSLYKKLLASRRFKGDLVKSISATTRPKRPGEKHGRDYLFLSRKKFLYKRRAGHFLESKRVFGYYYGTPRRNVERLLLSGKHVLLCIDVKGAKDVVKRYPKALRIFIKTAGLSELRRRLSKRGTEGPNDLRIRLAIARRELQEAKRYDAVVVNDDLGKAYRRLAHIVGKHLVGDRP